MSEVQKPVEDTPVETPIAVSATETPTTTEAPATETSVTEALKATAAENTQAIAEDKKEDSPAEEPKNEEVTPASEGVLGYKAPGLVKGLRFSKRYFHFSDDAVEAKQLSVYHQNEKPAIANQIAAWASQTGKGLLFFSKRAEDKATPAGIISLADVSDLTKEGANEFHFKVHGHKHAFQASSSTERDGWFAALEAKITEAKAEKETITRGDGYKAELERLTKPIVTKPVEKPAEKSAESKEDGKKEEAAVPAPSEENKEKEKATAKSRSQSRKRTSLFGSFLGKKEETEDKKLEESNPVVASAETPVEPITVAEDIEATLAPAAAASSPAPATAPEFIDKEEKEEPKEELQEESKEEKKPEAPVKAKRTSRFGNFFQKVTSPSHEKSEKEATAPADIPAVSSTAPQLDNPVEETPVKPTEPEKAFVPVEGEASRDASPAQSPAAETPVSATKDKRRSFFGNFGKKKSDSDNEGTDGESKAKGNKLGGLFRKPSKAVKSEAPKGANTTENDGIPKESTVEESPAEETIQSVEAPATEESKAVNVSTYTPVQAAA